MQDRSTGRKPGDTGAVRVWSAGLCIPVTRIFLPALCALPTIGNVRPGGTPEISPAFQRWEHDARFFESPGELEKFLSMAVMKAKKTVSGCSRPRRRAFIASHAVVRRDCGGHP